jgi:hypothetical protein
LRLLAGTLARTRSPVRKLQPTLVAFTIDICNAFGLR